MKLYSKYLRAYARDTFSELEGQLHLPFVNFFLKLYIPPNHVFIEAYRRGKEAHRPKLIGANISVVSRTGTENPVKDSCEIIKGVRRITKGAQFPPLDRFGDGEGIPTQQVDMVKEERRKPRHIFRLDGEPFGSKLLQSGFDV